MALEERHLLESVPTIFGREFVEIDVAWARFWPHLVWLR